MTFNVIHHELIPGEGYFTYVDGFRYPLRAFPKELDLNFVDILKRILIATARYVGMLPKIFWKPTELMAATLVWMGDIYSADVPAREGRRFQKETYAKSTLEILRALLAVNPITDDHWCYYLVAIWDTDMAYRGRGQDGLPLFNKNALLNNPKREIMRVWDVVLEREIGDVKHKLATFRKILRIALFFRVSRELLVNFFLELNLDKIRPDINDRYWTANKFDYNYEGKTYEERMAWRREEEKGWTSPKIEQKAQIAINQPNEAFYALNSTEAQKMVDTISKAIIDSWRERQKV